MLVIPSSHYSQLNEIMSLIFDLKPKSVLDVGIGFGKYGVLCREYLELWGKKKNYYRAFWTVIIDGIEIFEPYITPLHRFIYDNLYIGNAVYILPTLNRDYDLILLIDILEHFSFDNGKKLIKLCIEKGRNLIISTPRNIGSQKEVFENPFEEHIFQWTQDLFNSFLGSFKGLKYSFVPHKRSLIVYIKDIR